MQELIRAYDNKNKPILPGGSGILPKVYFNLLKLDAGETFTTQVPGMETVYVIQSGCCDVTVDGEVFSSVGRRASIWEGMADSVYAGAGAKVSVKAIGKVEIAVAGGACDKTYAPFRVRPEEVDIVKVGSLEFHCERRICHVLGQNANGRAGNMLVSELFCEPGCWSGYPPHTHGTGRGATETKHDEVYHYRFNPGNGFGAQYCFDEQEKGIVHMTRDGDTFAFSDGFHPTVTSPGHKEYVFTILVGHDQRSLVQRFHGNWAYLAKTIPGVQDMVDKFK